MPKGYGWSNPPSVPHTTEASKLRADEAGFTPAQRAQAEFQRALTDKAAKEGVDSITKPPRNRFLKALGL
jgi:hypothetical protein